MDRDTVIGYLENYARNTGIPVEHGVRAQRIDPVDGKWQVRTSAGLYRARHVVVATGRERLPVLPHWPGMTGFTGEIIHAADFGHVDAYRDRSVLVVGAGNSGTDILNHLVRIPTRSLRVSVRHGPLVVPSRLGGFPVHRFCGVMGRLPVPVVDALLSATERLAFGDLTRFGLRRHSNGAASRLAKEGVAPATDDGFIDGLKKRRVAVVPALERFDGPAVILSDGQALQPDIVICATGYRPGLEPLVGHLNVLQCDGIPGPDDNARQRACPGLWFIGMWPRLEGTFHAAGIESRRIAARICSAAVPIRVNARRADAAT